CLDLKGLSCCIASVRRELNLGSRTAIRPGHAPFERSYPDVRPRAGLARHGWRRACTTAGACGDSAHRPDTAARAAHQSTTQPVARGPKSPVAAAGSAINPYGNEPRPGTGAIPLRPLPG